MQGACSLCGCGTRGIPDIAQHFPRPFGLIAREQALIVVLIMPVSQQQVALDHLDQFVVAACVIRREPEPGHLRHAVIWTTQAGSVLPAGKHADKKGQVQQRYAGKLHRAHRCLAGQQKADHGIGMGPALLLSQQMDALLHIRKVLRDMACSDTC